MQIAGAAYLHTVPKASGSWLLCTHAVLMAAAPALSQQAKFTTSGGSGYICTASYTFHYKAALRSDFPTPGYSTAVCLEAVAAVLGACLALAAIPVLAVFLVPAAILALVASPALAVCPVPAACPDSI